MVAILHKVLEQGFNIHKTKDNRPTIELPYREDILFYKALKKALHAGVNIRLSFAHEKLVADSKLVKILANTANSEDFASRLKESVKSMEKSIGPIVAQGFLALVSLLPELIDKSLITAYEADYEFDENFEYYVLLKPSGNGINPQMIASLA